MNTQVQIQDTGLLLDISSLHIIIKNKTIISSQACLLNIRIMRNFQVDKIIIDRTMSVKVFTDN